jgi:hypothetical protein
VNKFRLGTVSAFVALAVLGVPGVAHASLSMTVPGSKTFPSVATGASSTSAQLGTVTITASGPNTTFTATVATTTFTTGGGSASETIAKANLSYWSGTATGTTGIVVPTPGQATAILAVTLSSARTAFTATGTPTFSVSWNPTVTITIPSSAVAGTYTGTITHSVA